jgi:hypothetical protein
MEQQTTTKELKALPFLKLSDLTADYVNKTNKKEFEQLPVIFKSTIDKKGRNLISINVDVVPLFMTQIALRPGGKYLTAPKFNNILLNIGAKFIDDKGKQQTEWKYKGVTCRFVKGQYSNRDGEYHSLEVIFKQGLYLMHFFDYDQMELLNTIEQKGLKKINWIERPDKIEFIETELETLNF